MDHKNKSVGSSLIDPTDFVVVIIVALAVVSLRNAQRQGRVPSHWLAGRDADSRVVVKELQAYIHTKSVTV